MKRGLTFFILALCLTACHKPAADTETSSSPSSDASNSFQKPNNSNHSNQFVATNSSEDEELEDGEYSCEVENTTQSNGPYSLDCEKIGNEINIEFNNGGYITVDIDTVNHSDEDTWEFETTDSKTSDSWDITINR